MFKYYIQDLFGMLNKDLVIKKDDLDQNLTVYAQTIHDLKDTVGLMLQVVNKDNDTGFKELQPIMKRLGKNVKNNKEILRELYSAYGSLEVVMNKFAEAIDDNFGQYTARDSMNARQVALLQYGENLFILADGLELLAVLASEKIVNTEPIYKGRPKFTIEYLYSNSEVFKSLFENNLYKELQNILKLPTSSAEQNKLRVILPKRNFTGKLFYSITSWWFLRQAEVIERKKATKKLLELRVAELRDQAMGQEPTLAVKKEIEYYESVIAELDKDIHEFYAES